VFKVLVRTFCALCTDQNDPLPAGSAL